MNVNKSIRSYIACLSNLAALFGSEGVQKCLVNVTSIYIQENIENSRFKCQGHRHHHHRRRVLDDNDVKQISYSVSNCIQSNFKTGGKKWALSLIMEPFLSKMYAI